MPNGFKIIMGVAKFYRILGINLGVPDIGDVKDLCKSGGGDNTYYLRVKANRQCIVSELEESNRYAEDDHLFISGNWEFGGPKWRDLTGFPTTSGSLQVNIESLSFLLSFFFCLCRTDVFLLLRRRPLEKTRSKSDRLVEKQCLVSGTVQLSRSQLPSCMGASQLRAEVPLFH